MTARMFGELIGVSGSFITQIENGFKPSITLATMLRLAEGTGMELVVTLQPKRKKDRRAA